MPYYQSFVSLLFDIVAIASGGKDMSAPKYWRGHIHILNRRGGSNLQDDYSAYLASPKK
jgi:hypothetical protein